MKQKFLSPLMVLAVVMGMMITSCSKKGELLDTIPANVNAVMMLDAKGLMENAGCKFTADGVELPESLKGMEASAGGLQTLGKLQAAGACDLSEVAVLVCDKQDIVCTFFINDWEKFKSITSSLNWEEGNDGYSEGRINGTPMLSDGTQGWIVIGGNPYELVKTLKEDAKKEPVTKLAGIKGVLESEHLFNLALSGMNFGATDNNVAQQETVWNVLSANVVDNKIVATSKAMKGDGAVVEVKGMQPINPAVLSYLPSNFNFALAAGMTPEFDWKAVIGALTPMFANNFQMQGALAVLTPFLQALDGTVVLAAGPANEEAYADLDPTNWQFVMMAHLPQERINQVMSMIKNTLAQNGIAPIAERDGVMTIPQYGMEFYVGNVDGYLAIANIPFENTHNNSLAPLFVNKNAALSFELPTLKVFSPAAPAYGIKVAVDMQGSEGKAEISLPGARRPILETILETLYGE